MPTLSNYRYFVEIAKDMNLETTANRLFVSHQGLSGHLRRLEKHYGVKIVKRVPKFQLTEDGRWLLKEAKKILAVEDNIISYFGQKRDMISGHIKLACSFFRVRNQITSAITQFNDIYPNVEVEIIDDNVTDIETLALRENADILLSNKKITSPKFDYRPLLKNYCYMVAGRKLLRKKFGEALEAFLEQSGDGIELLEFLDGECLSRPDVGDSRWWVFDYYPELASLPRSETAGHNTPDIILSKCKSGQHILVVTQLYVDNVKQVYSEAFLKGLFFIPILKDGSKIYMQEWLGWRSSDLPEYCKEFLQIIENVVNN